MIRSNRNYLSTAALFGAALMATSLAAPPALAQGSLVVRDFVMTHDIDAREPTDNTLSFAVHDGKAIAFARINNSGAPTTVDFVWFYGDEPHGTVTLNIGTSPGWRTWSSANLRPGDWRVQLVDASGELLMENSFTVGGASGMAQGMMGEDISPASYSDASGMDRGF